MNRFAMHNPEAFERGEVAPGVHRDDLPLRQEPCRTCGEYLTYGGERCKRCFLSIEDENNQHRPGKD